MEQARAVKSSSHGECGSVRVPSAVHCVCPARAADRRLRRRVLAREQRILRVRMGPVWVLAERDWQRVAYRARTSSTTAVHPAARAARDQQRAIGHGVRIEYAHDARAS
eukprot:4169186-Prymnesium_polylepis.1